MKSSSKVIRIAVASVFSGVLVWSANAAGPSLDYITPEGVRTVIKEDASYIAITADGASPRQVYAVTSSGGIEAWGFDKEWGTGNWSSATVAAIGTFTTLTHDGIRPNIVFGAKSEGGIVQFEWANQTWQANVVDESARVYTALTYDSVTPNRIYAASAEGVFEFTYTTSWTGRLLTSKIYKQLAANGTSEGLKFYGLDEDGHIDQLYFSGTWQTAAIDPRNSYATMTGDAVDSNKVYSALVAGGINQISYAGSWSVKSVVAGNTYSALANVVGKADELFAQTATELQMLKVENQWSPKTIFKERNYPMIIPGASADPGLFGLSDSAQP